VNTQESFSNSTCADQMPTATHDLSAFISAVTELVGPEQAMLSAEDWRVELTVAPPHRTPVVSSSTDTKVSPIPSSNCFASTLLV